MIESAPNSLRLCLCLSSSLYICVHLYVYFVCIFYAVRWGMHASLFPLSPYQFHIAHHHTNPRHLWLTTCMPGATAGCRPTRSHVSTAPPTAIHAKTQCLRLQATHCTAVPPPQVRPPHTAPTSHTATGLTSHTQVALQYDQ